jgi:hypothetical protein
VETSLEDVIKMAEAAGEKLSFLLKELMKTMR